MYAHPALAGIPWYATLGNHDYGPVEGAHAEQRRRVPAADGRGRGGARLAPTPKECVGTAPGAKCQYGPLPQLGARLRQRDGRWHAGRGYTHSPPGAAAAGVGGVEFFFFDTSPAVQRYRAEDWAANPGGLFEQSPDGNLAELGAALDASRARWRLVVAHHPPSGLRVPPRAPGLGADLCPVAAAGGAAAIISGHEHLMAYLAQPAAPCARMPQITTGAGGAVDSEPFTPNPGAATTPGSEWWQALEVGFVECAVGGDRMACNFWGAVEGAAPLYSAVVDPPNGLQGA